MTRRIFGFGALFLLCSAGVASASVRINEIAWMGSSASSTAEWIELVNDGSSAVDLSGWHIDAEDGSPSITLSGTIDANGYFLIERTNDLTVPNVTADLVASFGTGLSNGGETLRLKDGSAAVVDTVIGGANWVNIGGSNVTKETPQLTATGWVTASPTPRAATAGSGGGGGSSSAPVSQTAGTVSSAGVASGNTPSIYPRKNISVFAGEDQYAFVGFPVTFSGNAAGLYDEALTFATYHWNFGDGATGEGVKSSHSYLFPGDYVATLEVFWGSYRNSDRFLVTVTSSGAYIKDVAVGESGFIELANHSSQEIDLASWSLRAKGDDHSFIFPPLSVLLPGKTLILPNGVTHLVGKNEILELTYPNGSVAFTWNAPSVVSSANASEKEALGTVSNSRPLASLRKQNMSQSVAREEKDPELLQVASPGASVLWTGGEGQTRTGNIAGVLGSEWGDHATTILMLVALFLVVVACFIIVRSQRSSGNSLTKGYEVIEDIIEGDEG